MRWIAAMGSVLDLFTGKAGETVSDMGPQTTGAKP